MTAEGAMLVESVEIDEMTLYMLTYRCGKGRPDHEEGKVDKVLRHENLLGADNGKGDHDEAETEDADKAGLLLQSNLLKVKNQLERHCHDHIC